MNSSVLLISLNKEELKKMLESVLCEMLKKNEAVKESPEKEDVLSREKALQFIGCSSTTLLKYQKEGLPFYQIGRKVMFRKSEILEFSRVQLKTIV